MSGRIVMPEDWRPSSPADLIGHAGDVCRSMIGKARRLRGSERGRMVVLFSGNPGVGKSEIARFVSAELAESEHNQERSIGRQVSFEMALDWLRLAKSRSIFDGWQVRVIEEVDTIRRDAQDVLLQVMDEMSSCHAIIGTSNLDLSELSERFQTRFQVLRIEDPDPLEIVDFLLRRWPMIPKKEVRAIVEECGGNVRAALLDAQGWIDANWEDLHDKFEPVTEEVS